MKIAIIGAGNVGGALGTRWAAAGHTILFGTRDPHSEKIQTLLQAAGPNASATTAEAAVATAEVVVLATPWSATQSVVESLDLAGKIVVDSTNPIAPGFTLAVGHESSAGELVAQWAPTANVVKAFNTTGYNNMLNPTYGGQSTTLFIAGDDAAAKQIVTELAETLGFDVADTGPLAMARYLEPLAMVQGHGRDIALKLVRR